MGEGGEIGNHKGGWGINDPSKQELFIHVDGTLITVCLDQEQNLTAEKPGIQNIHHPPPSFKLR